MRRFVRRRRARACEIWNGASQMSASDDAGFAFSRAPALSATAVAAFSLAPHLFLPGPASLGFAAVLLGVIAGVYFGFAIMNGTFRDQLTELVVASGFGLAALLGLTLSPWLLPAAYIGHGLGRSSASCRSLYGTFPGAPRSISSSPSVSLCSGGFTACCSVGRRRGASCSRRGLRPMNGRADGKGPKQRQVVVKCCSCARCCSTSSSSPM